MTSKAMSIQSEDDRPNNKFHWLFTDGTEGRQRACDKPIFQSDNFAVLPSLGSIVPGWLLVLPKWPIARIADIDLSKRREFEDLVAKSQDFLEEQFGECCLFEHGGFSGSPVSCGVDQAHLHIVPLDFNLVEEARESRVASWKSSDSPLLPYDFAGEREYWYASSKSGSIYCEVSQPESQWFRKIIARKAGFATMWDYKSFEFSENIRETMQVMKLHG